MGGAIWTVDRQTLLSEGGAKPGGKCLCFVCVRGERTSLAKTLSGIPGSCFPSVVVTREKKKKSMKLLEV